MQFPKYALSSSIALSALLLCSCASAPHDTLAFKGVVYSRDAQNASGQTYAIPAGGASPLFITTGGGVFITYVLKLDDQSIYAVRSNTKYEVGDCLSVFMNSERAKSGGYLNIKETTVVPSTGCKATIAQ